MRFTAYDGSSAGPPDARRRDAPAHRARARLPADRAGRPRHGARLRQRRPRRCSGVHPGDPYDALVLLKDHTSSACRRRAEALAIVRSLGLTHLRPPPPPPQEHLPRWRRAIEGLRHSMARDAEVIAHHYDVSNRFYELVLGPSMAYTCAVYQTPDATPRGGAGREVRPGLPQARPEARPAAARRRLRLGRHGPARRARVRRTRAGRDAVAASRRSGPRRRSTARASATSPRCATSTTATSSSPASTRSARSASPSTSACATTRRTSRFLRDRLRPGGPAAQPLDHPAAQPAAQETGRVHRPLRLPRRGADRLRHDHHRGAGRRPRGAARGEPPPALRR